MKSHTPSTKRGARRESSILDRFGSRLSHRQKINLGIITLVGLVVLGGLIYAYQKGYFGLGAAVQQPTSITNQASVSYCTEGDATAVCDPTNNKYSGSGTSNTVTTTVESTQTNPPVLTITAPTAGQTIEGTTVNVTYTKSGDLAAAGVDHVHLTLDNNPEIRDLDFDGAYQFTNVPAGPHTITGYLAKADHAKVAGTDASVSFTTASPQIQQACFTVLLSNRTVNSQDHAYPVTVEFRNTSNTLIDSATVTAATDGKILIGEAQKAGIIAKITSGTFNITFKADGYLSGTVNGASNLLTQCLNPVTLKVGDFDNDGDIDLSDLLRVSLNRNGSRSDANVKAAYKNQAIQLKDLLHIVQNRQ